MSNSHLFLTSGFPRAPLQNGIGRFIGQLQRVTIKFCKNHGSSRGVREFLESDLLDFANKYPGIVVYVKPRRHRTPCLSAEYLNGETEYINCRNYSRDEVNKWLHLLRTQSGVPTQRLRKMWHTEHPSIQGPWSPFVHRDPHLNLADFPKEEVSRPVYLSPTATETLLELFKKQQAEQVPAESNRLQ